jgi:hypothetical protein
MGVKVMGGRSDRGFLGGFDRTLNTGKFPWGDQGMGDRAEEIDYPVKAVLEMARVWALWIGWHVIDRVGRSFA